MNDAMTRALAELLDGFVAAGQDAHTEHPQDDGPGVLSIYQALLSDYDARRTEWEAEQAKSPDDFNLLEILGVDCREACHSKMLAWLLASEIEVGTHAQGSLGFQLFLEELGIDRTYSEQPYRVNREVQGLKSRIDVEVVARDAFIIHIENKITAQESQGETKREWRDLQRRAADLGIPKDRRHAVFLTLDGSPAEEDHFMPVAWSRVAFVLEKFAERAEAPEVRLFASHYARALRRLSATRTPIPETENGDEALQ